MPPVNTKSVFLRAQKLRERKEKDALQRELRAATKKKTDPPSKKKKKPKKKKKHYKHALVLPVEQEGVGNRVCRRAGCFNGPPFPKYGLCEHCYKILKEGNPEAERTPVSKDHKVTVGSIVMVSFTHPITTLHGCYGVVEDVRDDGALAVILCCSVLENEPGPPSTLTALRARIEEDPDAEILQVQVEHLLPVGDPAAEQGGTDGEKDSGAKAPSDDGH